MPTRHKSKGPGGGQFAPGGGGGSASLTATVGSTHIETVFSMGKHAYSLNRGSFVSAYRYGSAEAALRAGKKDAEASERMRERRERRDDMTEDMGKYCSPEEMRRRKKKKKKQEGRDSILVIEDMEFDDASQMRITSDGYLACNPRVARTGIQLYKGIELDSPLDVVRVYRPEDEVFSASTIKSFSHRPVTNDHPPENVTARNWKKYTVGQTQDEVLRDGQFVRVPILLMDEQAIRDVQAGKKQLSAGYAANLVWDAGETEDGEQYDAIQTQIRVNHVAVCKAARGGPMLCLGDSFAPLMEDAPKQRSPKMTTITVDSVQLEMEDIAASVVKRTMDRLEGDAKGLKDQITVLTEAKKTHDTAAIELKKQVDTKDGEIAVLKQQLADAQMTPQKLDQHVRTRTEVVSRATRILGSAFVTDGKTDAEIKRAVCAAKIGDAAVKEMNDDAINGAFSALTVSTASDGNKHLALSFTPGGQPHNAQDAATIAYEERSKWLREAHRQTRKTA